MLATSACHQNKSNSDAIRQYAKRRTTVQLPSSLPFFNYYYLCSENYIMFRVMSWAVTLQTNVKNMSICHAVRSKQLTYIK